VNTSQQNHITGAAEKITDTKTMGSMGGQKFTTGFLKKKCWKVGDFIETSPKWHISSDININLFVAIPSSQKKNKLRWYPQ
jgi:hypothetical protein